MYDERRLLRLITSWLMEPQSIPQPLASHLPLSLSLAQISKCWSYEFQLCNSRAETTASGLILTSLRNIFYASGGSFDNIANAVHCYAYRSSALHSLFWPKTSGLLKIYFFRLLGKSPWLVAPLALPVYGTSKYQIISTQRMLSSFNY